MEFNSIYVSDIDKNKAIPILRGCKNKQCFCSGKCQEVVGYVEKGNIINPYPYRKNN